MATAANLIPTIVRPAPLMEVPATVSYQLKQYSRDEHDGRGGAVEHLEMHRNGKMVAMTNANRE